MPEVLRITIMGNWRELTRQADEVVLAKMGRDSRTLPNAKGLWVWMV
jgi:hypothetical protein